MPSPTHRPRAGAGKFSESADYTDTVYRIALKDRSIGTYKRTLQLRPAGTAVLYEWPIIWTHHEFITGIPERDCIGKKPVRVFLRCPDEQIELTKVVSYPTGVKVMTSSPREIIIGPTGDPRDKVEGYVRVATSDAKGRQLAVPVASLR